MPTNNNDGSVNDASDDANTTSDASATDATPGGDAAAVGTFAWAMAQADQGSTVKRAVWMSGYLVRAKPGSLDTFERSSNGGATWSVYTPTQGDVDATDWLTLAMAKNARRRGERARADISKVIASVTRPSTPRG